MPIVYDNMSRQANYPYSTVPANHRYSGTSSAFSPSANPNEDWTKISDLAERRRIQNRIAQRNYRKKLKKRLEDLERRAASNSASPEQKPAELRRPDSQSGDEYASSEAPAEACSRPVKSRRSPASTPQSQYIAPVDDRGMFSHQYTRQLSTSPPPFSYSVYPSEPYYATYPPPAPYQSIPYSSPEVQGYSPYLPPLTSAYPTILPSVAPIKQEPYYDQEESNPFAMSYASMAGIDIATTQSYHDSSPHTPPLSETFDHSSMSSPPDSTANYPTTPASTPGTPTSSHSMTSSY